MDQSYDVSSVWLNNPFILNALTSYTDLPFDSYLAYISFVL